MLRIKIVGGLIAALACAAVVVGPASAADTTPPTVSWQNTDMSGVVVGARTMTVDASDDTGVTAVEYDINGSLYASATDNGDGTWSAPFDGTSVPEGPVTITAVASDAAGNQATADISFTDSHDTTAPAITATSPSVSDTLTVVGTTLPVSVTATDDAAVTSVDVSVDQQSTWEPLTFNAVSGNWEGTVDVSSLADGTNGVSFRVLDAAGNVTDEFTVIDLVKVPTIPVLTVTAPADAYSVPNRPIQSGDQLVSYSSASATGAPDPDITYQWRICPALTSPASDCATVGSFDVALTDGDAGKYLELVTTATNVAGSDVNVLDLGVIAAAPAVTEPIGPQFGDPAPTSVVTPAVAPTAPAAVPVAVVLPVAARPARPGVTSAQKIAQKSVRTAQKQVAATTNVVAKARKAQASAVGRLTTARQHVAAAKSALKKGTAKAAERKKLAGAQKQLQAAETTVVEKTVAGTAKKSQLARARKKLDAGQSALSKLKGTAAAKAPRSRRPATKAVATAQKTVVAHTKLLARADAAEKAAVDRYAASKNQVAKATGKQKLATARHALVRAKRTVIATAVRDTAATSKLAAARKALATKSAKRTK